MPTPKQYADALSATPRNSWKYLADAMQPVSEFADEFKVKQDVPLIGGMSAADFTGLKGAFGLADDASYGKYPIRGASLQTTKVDPRVIDAMGLAGALMPVAKNVGKAALREGARQIHTGTGIGRAALDPRMNMFAGEGAKTANMEALKVANEMKASGVPDEAIHAKTGWTFGFPDGKPRFEIDDSGMSQKIPLTGWVDRKDGSFQAPNLSAAWDTAAADLTPQAPVRVMRLFDHNELSRAYPYGFIKGTEKTSIMDMPVQVLEDSATAGSFGDGSLALNGSLMPKEAKSTTLHELQHAIQQREGFARGGSPGKGADAVFDYSSPQVMALRRQQRNIEAQMAQTPYWDKAINDMNPAFNELQNKSYQLGQKIENEAAIGGYQRLAGEAEARLTQSRMNMTAPERAASYPPSMFDVPVKDQIVRYGDDVARQKERK